MGITSRKDTLTMKLFRTLTAILTLLLAASFAAAGPVEKEEKEDAAPKELQNQTLCPVMGGEIDSTIYTDIQGQRVYHCCPMCSDKLVKDPDTFFKKAAEDGVLFENIQTTCPISGEELEDKSVYTDFEGRRVIFCCKKCRGTFNEDPQKVLSKLDDSDVTQEDDQEVDHSAHQGHNH